MHSHHVRVAILAPSSEGAPPVELATSPHGCIAVAILAPSSEGAPPALGRCWPRDRRPLRSSPPPRRGRHADVAVAMLDARERVAILAPSSEGAPRRTRRGSCATQPRLRSSPPPRRGRHRRQCWPVRSRASCDPRPLLGGGATTASSCAATRVDAAVAILAPSSEGAPPTSADLALIALRSSPPPRRGRHNCVVTGRVAILAPSSEGAPLTKSRQRCRVDVAILAPSSEGAPPAAVAAACTTPVLRSSPPPRRGRHSAWRHPLRRLRSSPPPRRGRHCAWNCRSTDASCDPRPLLGGGATRDGCARRRLTPCCDPRPLLGGGATRLATRCVTSVTVAILAPSSEGAPRPHARTSREAGSRRCDPRPLLGGGATLPEQGFHSKTQGFFAILVDSHP